MMKLNWNPKKGDLVSIPDCIMFSKSRKYGIVTDVSTAGSLMEILLEDTFVYIHKDEVVPIIDLEGRWIQLGR